MQSFWLPLAVTTSIIFFGTLYSIHYDTYLDTSHPILSQLPHPLGDTHYWANKSNWLNVYFIKAAWGWTAMAFLFSILSTPPKAFNPHRTRQYTTLICRYFVETAVWFSLTSWFFGPPILERVAVYSGAECFLPMPEGEVLSVPHSHCHQGDVISVDSHPDLFTPFERPLEVLGNWRKKPRFRMGHDVSGHIFLLTMSILFLWGQVLPVLQARRKNLLQWLAVVFNVALIGLWLFACYTTSVYFHTPFEKLTGYVFGVFGFALAQIIFPDVSDPPRASTATSASDEDKPKA